MAALVFLFCMSALAIQCNAKISKKEWRRLENIHDLIQDEIKDIKNKVWGEVSAEIEYLKEKLDAALHNASLVEQTFPEKQSCDNSEVEILKRQLDEEQDNRRKLEDNMESFISQQLGTISTAFQMEKLKSIKLEAKLLEVTSTLNDFKKETANEIRSLQEHISSNNEKNKETGFFFENLEDEHRTILESHKDMTNILSEQIEKISKASEKPTAFGKPGFVSQWFLMKSQDETLSDLVVAHGLGALPYKVDVQTRPTDGDKWWIYPGASAFQSDDDFSKPYGGVVFFYNETHVTLFAPKKRNSNNDKGRIIYTGPEAFVGQYHTSLSEAYVRVKVWGPENMPAPDFQSEWLPLDINDKERSFYDITHSLDNYPALVSVYVRVSKEKLFLISDGIGATANRINKISCFGGVVWAYNSESVRIWSLFAEKSDPTYQWQTLLGDKDGWGNDKSTIDELDNLKQGSVKVVAWSRDHFIPGTNFYQCEGSIKSIQSCASMGQDSLESDLFFLSVQADDGVNKGYRFSGYGGAQAQNQPYGGVVYAYSREGGVRVWSPDPDQRGYSVHIHSPYGNGVNVQATNNISYVTTWIRS